MRTESSLYIHAERQDRTAERIRTLLTTKYSPSRGGLPENDDAGALSAWYVRSAMGDRSGAGTPNRSRRQDYNEVDVVQSMFGVSVSAPYQSFGAG